MNSKERVQKALKRQPVDRVPVFMWFNPDTATRLGKFLDIPKEQVSNAMGDDVRQAWVANNAAMEGVVHEHEGETHIDFWKIEWIRVGAFNQVLRAPLESADSKAIRDYVYPSDHIEDLLRNMDPVASAADRFFIGCDVSPCAFEMVCRLRGMENAAIDLAADPRRARAMLQQAAEFSRILAVRACERLPLDWLWTGDDVAGQQSMLMSPDCWRDLIRPALARVFDVGKTKGLPIAYHSCGAIRPIIPDLIEMGMDVLNPIQCACPGMNPLELKKEFGKSISFMGGVDTQGVLPYGTEDDVRRATDRLLEGMTADGGGYILAASHTVPPETPLNNIFAMYETAGIGRDEILDRAADIRASLSKRKASVR